jgi:hypothetical protein
MATFWITRYWQSKGVLTVEAEEWNCAGPQGGPYIKHNFSYYYYNRMDYARSPEEAVKFTQELQERKLDSLERTRDKVARIVPQQLVEKAKRE